MKGPSKQWDQKSGSLLEGHFPSSQSHVSHTCKGVVLYLASSSSPHVNPGRLVQQVVLTPFDREAD